MNFNAPDLLEQYGSWVGVQVAFYDFIFQHAASMCGTHFNGELLNEIADGGFSDGGGLYERTKRAIEQAWATPEDAWADFIKDEIAKESSNG